MGVVMDVVVMVVPVKNIIITIFAKLITEYVVRVKHTHTDTQTHKQIHTNTNRHTDTQKYRAPADMVRDAFLSFFSLPLCL